MYLFSLPDSPTLSFPPSFTPSYPTLSPLSLLLVQVPESQVENLEKEVKGVKMYTSTDVYRQKRKQKYIMNSKTIQMSDAIFIIQINLKKKN